MHIHRSLSTIKAITFDLDDTLYDNRAVIEKALTEAHLVLQNYHPSLAHYCRQDYENLCNVMSKQYPELHHDVTNWRIHVLRQLMLNAGLSATKIEQGVDQIMTVFLYWRNQINIPTETHTVLAGLAEKVPLAVITNGNAEPARFNLHSYFQFILRAGPDGRAKPWHDMYHHAAQRLNIAPENILHVGDDLLRDVSGSLRMVCRHAGSIPIMRIY